MGEDTAAELVLTLSDSRDTLHSVDLDMCSVSLMEDVVSSGHSDRMFSVSDSQPWHHGFNHAWATVDDNGALLNTQPLTCLMSTWREAEMAIILEILPVTF